MAENETTQAAIPLGSVIRNRVIERTRMLGSALTPHPLNWRVHPEAQKAGLRGVLREVGMVGEVYAYYSESAGGKLTLIDGHLRSSDEFAALEWDVAITDLNDEEAAKVLLSMDNIGMMAQGSVENLEALLRQVKSTDEELSTFLTETALDYGIVAFPDAEPSDPAAPADEFPKFEDEAATHVKCPACHYEWSLTASEIAKFKLKGKKPKASKKKKKADKGTASHADEAEEEEVDEPEDDD
jgi:hypothetical protein